jgi:hypothetical protein
MEHWVLPNARAKRRYRRHEFQKLDENIAQKENVVVGLRRRERQCEHIEARRNDRVDRNL